MNSKLLALFVLCAVAQEPEIIDFTYTQLLQDNSQGSGYHHAIRIDPEEHSLQQFQFPQVCSLQDGLQEGTDSAGAVDSSQHPDDYLQVLRGKVLVLLQLAQRIKDSRNYLNEISKHLDMRSEEGLVDRFAAQIEQLARAEHQLAEHKHKIELLNAQLQQLIEQYNRNPRSTAFQTVALHFEAENAKAKAEYLRQIRENSIQQNAQDPHTNFTDFFARLSTDLKTESQQIQRIDEYFQNVSRLNYLRDSANSLRDNIEVDKLNIEYKRSCEREKQDIRGKSSTPSEIRETLNDLRAKKKEFGNTTNKYCEGVALKLEMQIKRLLRAMNWTFMCADGLRELEAKVEQDQRELQSLQNQIKGFGRQDFEVYHGHYEATKAAISSRLQQIKHFSINPYRHDPAHLDQLIRQAEASREQAQRQIAGMPAESPTDSAFEEIKRLARQIKAEKVKFCSSYAPYEVLQRRTWLSVLSAEQEVSYSSKMRAEFILESGRLRVLEQEYRRLSETITQQIELNYGAE